jgi:hypothetical protein
MFQLQVKFPGQDWKNTSFPPRNQYSAERLLQSYTKNWQQYAYRLVLVSA